MTNKYTVPIHVDPTTCITWPVDNAADHAHAEELAKTQFIASLQFGPAMKEDDKNNEA